MASEINVDHVDRAFEKVCQQRPFQMKEIINQNEFLSTNGMKSLWQTYPEACHDMLQQWNQYFIAIQTRTKCLEELKQFESKQFANLLPKEEM